MFHRPWFRDAHELPVPEEGFRALPEPEADDAEVVCKILDVLGFYKIRVPLLGQQYKKWPTMVAEIQGVFEEEVSNAI